MHPFQALLAADHLEELRRDAAARRRAHEAQLANADPGVPGGGGARRGLAQVAIRLSRAAAGMAERLDPPVTETFTRRRPSSAPGC